MSDMLHAARRRDIDERRRDAVVVVPQFVMDGLKLPA